MFFPQNFYTKKNFLPEKGVKRTVIEWLPTFDVNSTFETVRLKGILLFQATKP